MAKKKDYELYRIVNGYAITSRRTVVKIKKLLEKDRLKFLLDHPGGLMGHIKDRLTKDNIGDQSQGIYVDPKDPAGSQRLGVAIKEIHWAEIQVSKMAEGWRWDVGHLEEIKIPIDAALDILKSYDEAWLAKEDALHNGDTAGTSGSNNFAAVGKYVKLHYLVIFKTRYPNADFPYIVTASDIYVRGLLSSNKSLWTAGEDILRYEIWKGDKHREAYDQSLGRHKRTPRALASLKARIDTLL